MFDNPEAPTDDPDPTAETTIARQPTGDDAEVRELPDAGSRQIASAAEQRQLSGTKRADPIGGRQRRPCESGSTSCTFRPYPLGDPEKILKRWLPVLRHAFDDLIDDRRAH